MYSPILVLLYEMTVFLQKVVPVLLLIIGVIMFINGMKKRFKTKDELKPQGFSLIIAGALVFLPGGIICSGRIIKAVDQAIDDYNNIRHQMWSGSAEDMERLLKKGVNAQGESYTQEYITSLLADVADYGLIPDAAEKAGLLIEYGADVNKVMCWRCEPDHSGYRRDLCSSTPVLIACDSPNYDLLKVLIDNGGNVNAIDYYGYSALDIIDRNIIDADERFHYSFTEVFEQMKELLIESGAKYSTAEKPSKTGPDKNRY